MKVKAVGLQGVYEIILEPRLDHRGFFMRTYDKQLCKQLGIDREWVQENHALSKQKGTLRGLHFQWPPFAETKLVRVIQGAVLDVFVDLRKGSPSFGQWGSIELSAANKKMIYIPKGFAHGYCTLTENTEIVYKVDAFYNPQYEAGIAWNDPALNIPWPVANPILSEKDTKQPLLQEFKQEYEGLDA